MQARSTPASAPTRRYPARRVAQARTTLSAAQLGDRVPAVCCRLFRKLDQTGTVYALQPRQQQSFQCKCIDIARKLRPMRCRHVLERERKRCLHSVQPYRGYNDTTGSPSAAACKHCPVGQLALPPARRRALRAPPPSSLQMKDLVYVAIFRVWRLHHDCPAEMECAIKRQAFDIFNTITEKWFI